MNALTDLNVFRQPSVSQAQSRPTSPPLRRFFGRSLSAIAVSKASSISFCSCTFKCPFNPLCDEKVRSLHSAWGHVGGCCSRMCACRAVQFGKYNGDDIPDAVVLAHIAFAQAYRLSKVGRVSERYARAVSITFMHFGVLTQFLVS